ncbi:MAG TPA: IS21 family transposase [Lutibacter sp.]|nr:IS21 family transposase [Lutibacter sp.]
MAAKKVDIMELKQLLLLKSKGESNRSCERLLGIHRNTINPYVQMFRASGLSYSTLLEYSEKELNDLLPAKGTIDSNRYGTFSDYLPYFTKELKKPGCTREQLWREYITKHPNGYGYSTFNGHLARWRHSTKGSGKLDHKYGDAIYVDYTGKKMQIVNKQTGEEIDVEIFVGMLPASQYTFVEATMSQKKDDFISSMNRCLQYFGGVPQTIVTDNLKSAVIKSSKYSAVLNKSLKDMAVHYKTSINPTRSYSPQDKALVEGAVKLVYQRIFYPLDKQTFFSLSELNKAINEKLSEYNNFHMKQLGTSRFMQFSDHEKTYLSPLPSQPYELKEYKKAKVQKMGFVYLHHDKNYYSVPYRYIGYNVEVQYTSEDVEIYYKSERIANHKRNYKRGSYTKKDDHLSSSHKFYKDWSPSYFINWAKKSGNHVAAYTEKLLNQNSYPEIAYKQCLGIINLKKDYSEERLDKACEIAMDQYKHGYHIIKNILINKMDIADNSSTINPHITEHDNIRGAEFYN